MLFIPYSVDVFQEKSPWANVLLIGATTALFLVSAITYVEGAPFAFQGWVLDGWSFSGLTGSLFLHAGFLHLLANMLYLWIFGNALCGKLGNGFYLLLYFLLGIAAGAFHLIFDGSRAIGASGAVYGLIGFYLALYPVNRIYCFYWLYITYGTVRISGYWLIGFWVATDIYGIYQGESLVAYYDHLGGFIAGVASGFFLDSRGWVTMNAGDYKTLRQYFFAKQSE